MGEIDIDCRDEKDTIIIDLAGQLDVCNSQELNLFVMPYKDRGFDKLIISLEKVTYLDRCTFSLLTNCYHILKGCH